MVFGVDCRICRGPSRQFTAFCPLRWPPNCASCTGTLATTTDLWAERCPPRCIQLHAPCKLPPTALGSAFCILVQMRPCPREQRLLVFPVILVARLLSTSMLVPVDCVAMSDAPRCFVCLWTLRYSLLFARTAFNNNHRLKKKFVTIDVPAMGVAMQSVLSQCFETHDGLREGLWRLLVAQSPFSRLALPHAILCYLSFWPHGVYEEEPHWTRVLLVHHRETRDCAHCQWKLCDIALDFVTVVHNWKLRLRGDLRASRWQHHDTYYARCQGEVVLHCALSWTRMSSTSSTQRRWRKAQDHHVLDCWWQRQQLLLPNQRPGSRIFFFSNRSCPLHSRAL